MKFNNYLILSLFLSWLIFMNCSSIIQSINKIENVKANDTTGYLCLKFINKSGFHCVAFLKNIETKKKYRISLDPPIKREANLYILGINVYKKDYGDTINTDLSIIPLSKGKYKIELIQIIQSNPVYNKLIKNTYFNIESGKLTYIGQIQTDFFYFLYLWKSKFITTDQSEFNLQVLSKNFPVTKQLVYLQ